MQRFSNAPVPLMHVGALSGWRPLYLRLRAFHRKLVTCLDLGVAEQSFGVLAAKRSGFAKDACPETLQRELGPGAWDKSLSINLNQAELACSRSCLWQVSSRPACLEESCRLVQGGHTVLFCGNAEPRLFLKHPHSEWNKDRGSLEKSARQQIRFAFIAGVLFVVGVGLKDL